jgi:hypothetical protein
MELFPEGLAVADANGYLPLHRILQTNFSSVEDALCMIETYPEALRLRRNDDGSLPIHIECIILLCGLYPLESDADRLLLQNLWSSILRVLQGLMNMDTSRCTCRCNYH